LLTTLPLSATLSVEKPGSDTQSDAKAAEEAARVTVRISESEKWVVSSELWENFGMVEGEEDRYLPTQRTSENAPWVRVKAFVATVMKSEGDFAVGEEVIGYEQPGTPKVLDDLSVLPSSLVRKPKSLTRRQAVLLPLLAITAAAVLAHFARQPSVLRPLRGGARAASSTKPFAADVSRPEPISLPPGVVFEMGKGLESVKGVLLGLSATNTFLCQILHLLGAHVSIVGADKVDGQVKYRWGQLGADGGVYDVRDGVDFEDAAGGTPSFVIDAVGREPDDVQEAVTRSWNARYLSTAPSALLEAAGGGLASAFGSVISILAKKTDASEPKMAGRVRNWTPSTSAVGALRWAADLVESGRVRELPERLVQSRDYFEALSWPSDSESLQRFGFPALSQTQSMRNLGLDIISPDAPKSLWGDVETLEEGEQPLLWAHDVIDLEERIEATNITPLVVFATASWCQACRALRPTVRQLVRDFPGVKWVCVDIDNPEDVPRSVALRKAIDVKVVPSFQMYRKGEKVDEIETTDKTVLARTIGNLLKDHKKA